jgi:hypothetical protein
LDMDEFHSRFFAYQACERAAKVANLIKFQEWYLLLLTRSKLIPSET